MATATLARRSLFTPADGATVAPVASLFIEELDGVTYATAEDAYWHSFDEADALAEIEAEMAVERALETNDRYAWECEQDELRAQAFGFGY
jgi:hypothetical protein